MKRYLKGWMYDKIFHDGKLMMLGSFLLFYAGLFFTPLKPTPKQEKLEITPALVIELEEDKKPVVDLLKSD